MENLQLRMTIQSPTLLSRGEGFSSAIDDDIVFDEFGIPYIPGKRIKGLLRDAARDVGDMLGLSGINHLSRHTYTGIFGEEFHPGGLTIRISNLYPAEYESIREWIQWGQRKHKNLINTSSTIEHFTEIRQQTAIDEHGTAKDHSLRVIRALSPGVIFWGTLKKSDFSVEEKHLLALAVRELRFVGSNRNRGFGEVSCDLFEHDRPIDADSFFHELSGESA